MAVYHQHMSRSEEKDYLKGGCMSVVMLILLGGLFVGSIHLVVWLFG